MKVNISTVTIEEKFSKKCGCPICNLELMLETRCIDYITGSAMMEPDVRAETDCLGFCEKHFDMMLETERRLSCAMLLQTRLNYIEKNFFNPKIKKPDKKFLNNLNENTKSCYVCNSMHERMAGLYDSVINYWIKSDDFKKLYAEQDYICLQHYSKLISLASKTVPSRLSNEFFETTKKLALKKLVKSGEELEKFCSMFDYRNKEKDFSSVSNSIENAAQFLTKTKNKDKIEY